WRSPRSANCALPRFFIRCGLCCRPFPFGALTACDRMKRRHFIALLGGTVAAKTVVAGDPPSERKRRVGMLMPGGPRDPESKALVAAFLGALRELSWTEEQNLRIDICWAAVDLDRARSCAAKLVNLAPDVILAITPLAVAALFPSYSWPLVIPFVLALSKA